MMFQSLKCRNRILYQICHRSFQNLYSAYSPPLNKIYCNGVRFQNGPALSAVLALQEASEANLLGISDRTSVRSLMPFFDCALANKITAAGFLAFSECL